MTIKMSDFIHNSTAPYGQLLYKKEGQGVLHDVKSIALGVLNGAKSVFVSLGNIRRDANTFGRLIGLGCYGFTAVEIALKKPGNFSHISDRLTVTNSTIDSMQVFDCVHYAIGKGSKKTIQKSMGYGAMFVACLGNMASVLNDCKLISFAGVVQKIRSIPVIGKVTELGVSFGQVMTGIAGFGYGCFGAEAIDRVVNEKTDDKKRQAWIDLAWFVSEVVASMFVIFASACVVGLVVSGVVAVIAGIASHLHEVGIKKKKDE